MLGFDSATRLSGTASWPHKIQSSDDVACLLVRAWLLLRQPPQARPPTAALSGSLEGSRTAYQCVRSWIETWRTANLHGAQSRGGVPATALERVTSFKFFGKVSSFAQQHSAKLECSKKQSRNQVNYAKGSSRTIGPLSGVWGACEFEPEESKSTLGLLACSSMHGIFSS